MWVIYLHTNTEPARTAYAQDGINQKDKFMNRNKLPSNGTLVGVSK
jgi:hypothetical protein